MTIGFLRAVRQIPADASGIVVVRADDLPQPALARLMLDALCNLPTVQLDGKQEIHIRRARALLVTPALYLTGPQRPSLLLKNDRCTFGTAADPAVEALCSGLKVLCA